MLIILASLCPVPISAMSAPTRPAACGSSWMVLWDKIRGQQCMFPYKKPTKQMCAELCCRM
jgi:hypothetical protein